MRRLSNFSALWESKAVENFFRFAWFWGVLLLPVTSFPLLVKISGASTVAPPSILVFIFIGLAWLVPYILRNGSLPLEIGPFLVFVAAAVFSWGLSFALPIPPFRSFSIVTEYPGAFITLSFAIIIFITTATWAAAKPDRLRYLLKIICFSGFILILWSLVQAYYVLVEDGAYPLIVIKLQKLISSRGGTWLFADRVTGMAYEPSWLAHQLVLVYIPIWFSATITNYSVFSKRIFRFSIENILLIGGVIVLFLSFSRIGWLSFLLMVAFAAIYVNVKLIRKIQAWLSKRIKGSHGKIFSVVSTGIVIVLFSVGYLGLAIGAVYLGSQFEPRLAKILATDFSTTKSFFDFSNRLFIAERVVYWAAGLDVFEKFPWFGVGIGNSGFFFPKTMPSFGYALVEIKDMFYRFTFMPNTKSMWVRMLAETGIVGFSFFITWLFVIFNSSRFARKFGTPELKFMGWMGQFVVVAFLAEGFSIDSFALPYLWFSLGLASAAASLTRNKVKLGLVQKT